jgi:hypothetical protein
MRLLQEISIVLTVPKLYQNAAEQTENTAKGRIGRKPDKFLKSLSYQKTQARGQLTIYPFFDFLNLVSHVRVVHGLPLYLQLYLPVFMIQKSTPPLMF